MVIVVVIIVALLGGYALMKNSKEIAPVAPAPKETAPIKIGFMGPLTGDAASYGESIKKGVDLAKKEIGLANVEVVYEDSKCDPKESVNAVNKLITVDKVAAIVGDVCSGATLAAAPIAEQNKVVMISPASTAPKLTDAGQFIFRVIPSDALQGEFGAKLAYDKGYKNLAILYGNEEYGVGFNKVLSESFTKLGGTVVASESFETNATDLRTQITKIKAKKPDVIYIISNAPSAAVSALKQIKQLNLKVAVFGSEGLKSPDILSGAKDAAEGLILTSVTSGSADFLANHKAEYNADPGPFAAQGYDAFKTVALAIQTVQKAGGTVTGDAIRTALSSLEFDGASGHIKFDQNGDVSGNYEVYKVEKGAFVIVK